MLISPVVLIACDSNVDTKRNNLNLESGISQKELTTRHTTDYFNIWYCRPSLIYKVLWAIS